MRERDDRVTVVETGRSGSGAGLIGGIIGALVVVGLLVYFIGIPAFDGGTQRAEIDVNLPNIQAPSAPATTNQ
jgi:hypothetical protein